MEDGDSQLVFFEGPWSDEERDLITRSAEQIQSVRPLGEKTSHGFLWVCSMQQTPSRTLYVAHVRSDPDVIHARTAQELTEKMYERAGVDKNRDRGFSPEA